MPNLPKIVHQRLASPAVQSHPDPDLLTAFAERALGAREREEVIDHLARCGDCRDVVALALPATEAAAVGGTISSARAGWLSLPVLRWSVVAAGLLAVASVGVMQYRQHRGETAVATNLTMPEKRADTVAQPAPPLPAASQAAPSQATPSQPERVPETAKESAKVKDKDKDTPVEIAKNAPTPRAGGIVSGGGFAASRSAGSAHESLTGPGAAGPGSADQIDTVVRAKPTLPPAASQSVVAAAPPSLGNDLSRMKTVGPTRWTIGSNGVLQRSHDGGRTWQDVTVAANEPNSFNRLVVNKAAAPSAEEKSKKESETTSDTVEVKPEASYAAKSSQMGGMMKQAPAAAGAVPVFRALAVFENAAEVWAGGSGGALYHTTDGGNQWTRVIPSDAGGVLAGDVVRIQFSDPRTGTVTSSNGDAWITNDDGQTWHKRQ